MELASKEKCCGCSACYAVCPTGAISMVCNEEGFEYPNIDENKCIECKKCQSVCPILNKDKLKIKKHNEKVIHGFYKDDKKHEESASGGAANVLAEFFVVNKGYIYGSAYSQDYKKAHYIEVSKKEELGKLKGSKYIETTKDNIYRKVQSRLKDNELVLFIGLPCDVAGLKSYLGVDFDKLYTCELICHGPTTQVVQKKYIEELETRYNSEVISFNSRFKVNGSQVPYIKVKLKNGSENIEKLWDSDYGYAFANYCRESCYQCSFKDCERVADISIGDSWRLEHNYGNKKGVSVVYAHTEKGLELINIISQNKESYYEELDYSLIKTDNPAIYKSVEKTVKREKLSNNLKKYTLKKACFKSRTPIEKIKYIMKRIIRN